MGNGGWYKFGSGIHPPSSTHPYILLSQIPGDANWFLVLDLKDASFCAPSQESPGVLLPLKILMTS